MNILGEKSWCYAFNDTVLRASRWEGEDWGCGVNKGRDEVSWLVMHIRLALQRHHLGIHFVGIEITVAVYIQGIFSKYSRLIPNREVWHMFNSLCWLLSPLFDTRSHQNNISI